MLVQERERDEAVYKLTTFLLLFLWAISRYVPPEHIHPSNPQEPNRRLRRLGVDFIDDRFIWFLDGTVVPLVRGGATTSFLCGFECGSDQGHWTGANATYVTSSPRSGLRCLRLNPTAAKGNTFPLNDIVAGQNVFVFRGYLRFDTLPEDTTWLVDIRSAGSGSAIGACYFISDSTIRTNVGGNQGSSGVVVTTGTYYRITMKVNISANPWTVDIEVNGTSCAQRTAALAANTFTTSSFRIGDTDNNRTFDLRWDDVAISFVAGDHPLPAGHIISSIPNADGSHNIAGANDFERTLTGTDITNATTTAWQLVADRPLPITAVDFLNGVAPPNSTDYVEIAYEDASSETEAPRAVEALAVVHDAGGAGTNNYTLTLRDHGGGTSANIFSGTQNTGSALLTRRAHFTTIPGGGAWTLTAFNALRTRFLVTDASPDPYVDALMLEAEFPDPGVSLAPSAVAVPVAIPTPTITRQQTISPSAQALPISVQTPTITKTLTRSPSPVAVPLALTTPTIVHTKTLSPSPVAVPVALTTPTILRQQIISPSAVAAPTSIPAPTITKTLALAPTPVAAPLSVQQPTLTKTLTISPSPATAPIALPAPTVNISGGTTTLTPDARTLPVVVPAPTLTHTLTLSPTAQAALIVLPAPAVALGAITISPTPATAPLSVPAPTVALGALTRSPDPQTLPISVPTPTLTKTYALVPSPVAAPVSVQAPTVTKTYPLAPAAQALPVVLTAPAISHVLTLAPDPRTLPVSIPTPTIQSSGQVLPAPVALPLVVAPPTIIQGTMIAPSPVNVPITVVQPSVTTLVTLAPQPVQTPVALPSPSVAFGARTLSPNPVQLPLVNAAPTVTLSYTLTPTPVQAPIAVGTPNVIKGALTLSPTAVALALVSLSPSVALSLLLSPTPVDVPISVQAPSITSVKTISPEPLALPIVIGVPLVSGGVNILITPLPVVIALIMPAVVLSQFLRSRITGQGRRDVVVSGAGERNAVVAGNGVSDAVIEGEGKLA